MYRTLGFQYTEKPHVTQHFGDFKAICENKYFAYNEQV